MLERVVDLSATQSIVVLGVGESCRCLGIEVQHRPLFQQGRCGPWLNESQPTADNTQLFDELKLGGRELLVLLVFCALACLATTSPHIEEKEVHNNVLRIAEVLL